MIESTPSPWDSGSRIDKNSYYQQYGVKQLIAFRKQAMMKQNIYENMLARKSGMIYSPGIQFQKNLINTEKEKALTINNQPGKQMDKKNGSGVAA